MSHTKTFIIGAVAGIIISKLVRTNCFRKSCARVLNAGLQLKNDAAEFAENVKEDVKDMSSECDQAK